MMYNDRFRDQNIDPRARAVIDQVLDIRAHSQDQNAAFTNVLRAFPAAAPGDALSITQQRDREIALTTVNNLDSDGGLPAEGSTRYNAIIRVVKGDNHPETGSPPHWRAEELHRASRHGISGVMGVLAANPFKRAEEGVGVHRPIMTSRPHTIGMGA